MILIKLLPYLILLLIYGKLNIIILSRKSFAILNSQNEWFFDTNDNYLYVRLTNDVHPDTVQIRAKFQTYAFNIINHNVKIYDFDFFGTTLEAVKIILI